MRPCCSGSAFPRPGNPHDPSSRAMIPPELLEILVCPRCKGDLEYRRSPEEQLVCHACRLIYRVEDDIPIMLIDEATPL